MAAPLSDVLQIWGFESGFIVFGDGSYGFGLDLLPIDVSSWDDERIDALAARLGLFLNSLPTEIDFQLMQEIGKGNREIIDKNLALAKEGLGSAITALHERRIAKLQGEEAAGQIPKQTLKAFIRRKSQSTLIEKPRLFSKATAFEEITEQALHREITLTSALRDEVMRSFASFDVQATPIEERELAEFLYAQWNPLRQVPLADYDPQDLRLPIALRQTPHSLFSAEFFLNMKTPRSKDLEKYFRPGAATHPSDASWINPQGYRLSGGWFLLI